MNGIVQTHDVILEGGTARGDHAVKAHVLANLFDNGRCLQRQFARGDENEDCGLVGHMRRVRKNLRFRTKHMFDMNYCAEVRHSDTPGATDK